jgi:hypothetical protein
MLFDVLSTGGDVLQRSSIIAIIDEYELPIDLNEFFAPIGKKEDMVFADFCGLFRCRTQENTLFFKTFTSSFQNAQQMRVESGDLFPVHVIPRNL